MTERPILFNGEMVRAILEGRKTVTRRVVKARPDKSMGKSCVLQPHELAGEVNAGDYRNCPFGQPGDQLWVRETWQDVHPVQVIDRYSQPGHAGIPGPPGVNYQTIYRADGDYPVVYHTHQHPYRSLEPDLEHGLIVPAESGWTGWTPSIHMPRWACRILLEVTAVRVEPLQDISRGDAMAEGCPFPNLNGAAVGRTDPIGWFSGLWESTGGDWQANPWVWVIEFKQVTV